MEVGIGKMSVQRIPLHYQQRKARMPKWLLLHHFPGEFLYYILRAFQYYLRMMGAPRMLLCYQHGEPRKP
jgi:hypothetical protein